jgi:hypothetical protein
VDRLDHRTPKNNCCVCRRRCSRLGRCRLEDDEPNSAFAGIAIVIGDNPAVAGAHAATTATDRELTPVIRSSIIIVAIFISQ